MQCSGVNSCHQLKANIFGEERGYIGGIELTEVGIRDSQ